MGNIFEEVGGGGGSDKKKRWIMIGIGTAIIAIFLVIRNSTRASQAAQQNAAANAPAPIPQITDTGGYPNDSFGGGMSGTGMDQTLATYLAIADQNASVQMGAVNDTLHTLQDQMNNNNATLQQQITAINTAHTVAGAVPALPVTTSTADNTSHPDPHSISLIHFGNYATPRGGWNPNSVVDNLKQAGAVADMNARKSYASQAGINNYTGTAAQNVQLLNTLKAQGK